MAAAIVAVAAAGELAAVAASTVALVRLVVRIVGGERAPDHGEAVARRIAHARVGRGRERQEHHREQRAAHAPTTLSRARLRPPWRKKYETPKGTRDYLPTDMRTRRAVFDRLRRYFELYGFEELDTPAFEYLEVLTLKSGARRGERDLLVRRQGRAQARAALRPHVVDGARGRVVHRDPAAVLSLSDRQGVALRPPAGGALPRVLPGRRRHHRLLLDRLRGRPAADGDRGARRASISPTTSWSSTTARSSRRRCASPAFRRRRRPTRCARSTSCSRSARTACSEEFGRYGLTDEQFETFYATIVVETLDDAAARVTGDEAGREGRGRAARDLRQGRAPRLRRSPEVRLDAGARARLLHRPGLRGAGRRRRRASAASAAAGATTISSGSTAASRKARSACRSASSGSSGSSRSAAAPRTRRRRRCWWRPLDDAQFEAAERLALALRRGGVATRLLPAMKRDKIFKYSTAAGLPQLILVGADEAASGVYALRTQGGERAEARRGRPGGARSVDHDDAVVEPVGGAGRCGSGSRPRRRARSADRGSGRRRRGCRRSRR